MSKKHTKPCPLKLSEWVQYLTYETNRERYDYYDEELSVLTKTIVILTSVNVLLVFMTILNAFKNIPEEPKIILFVLSGGILIVILLYFKKKVDSFSKLKGHMDKTINEEAKIIEDILNGDLIDSVKIRKRYMRIWNNKYR